MNTILSYVPQKVDSNKKIAEVLQYVSVYVVSPFPSTLPLVVERHLQMQGHFG